jgi:hypothetical protein
VQQAQRLLAGTCQVGESCLVRLRHAHRAVAHQFRGGLVEDVHPVRVGREDEQGDHRTCQDGRQGEQPGAPGRGDQQREAGRGHAEQPDRLPDVHGGGERDEHIAHLLHRR